MLSPHPPPSPALSPAFPLRSVSRLFRSAFPGPLTVCCFQQRATSFALCSNLSLFHSTGGFGLFISLDIKLVLLHIYICFCFISFISLIYLYSKILCKAFCFIIFCLLASANHPWRPHLGAEGSSWHGGGRACWGRSPGSCVTMVFRVYSTPSTPGLPVHQSNFMSNIFLNLPRVCSTHLNMLLDTSILNDFLKAGFYLLSLPSLHNSPLKWFLCNSSALTSVPRP